MAAPESALHGGIPRPFATRPAFSPAYRGKTTKKYSTLLHFLPFYAILLRQYRTKIVRQMRRQIFRQMKQKAEWILDVFTSILVKYESLLRI